MPDMPRFEKSPSELVERFFEVLERAGTPETTRRLMFGYPCAWVGGNMATGLFASTWWVRLPPDRLAAVLASGQGRTFEVMPGRAMKGYAALPDGVIADDGQIEAWVREAIEYTATLPARAPKPRAPKPRRG